MGVRLKLDERGRSCCVTRQKNIRNAEDIGVRPPYDFLKEKGSEIKES